MVDVLITHSYYLQHDPKQAARMRPYAPLSALYAASGLRQAGYSVALFDAMLADGNHEFVDALRAHRPRYVALIQDNFNFLLKMCLTRTREAAQRMLRAARDLGIVTIAAGPDVSDNPQPYMEAGLDYALIGEPEHALLELIATLREQGAIGSSLSNLPDGLAWLDPDRPEQMLATPRRAPVRSPDVFPPPAWDLVDAERYRSAWKRAHGYYSVNLATSRGCPYRCNWCAKPTWGNHYAVRSPESVAEEMALVKSRLRPDHIWFADDLFGLKPGWVVRLADEVETRDARVPFTIQARADRMTEETVAALSRCGCVEVWMGAESGSQRILDAMDKDMTVGDIRLACRHLRQGGIRACLFIQLGYPGEVLDDILATVRMVRETLPDQIGISVSYPLPGTRFYEMVHEHLGAKQHWTDSGDLAMMFRGTYTSGFYRQLHGLLHRDLQFRQQLAAGTVPSDTLMPELDALNDAWLELGRMERESHSAEPTRIHLAAVSPAGNGAAVARSGA